MHSGHSVSLQGDAPNTTALAPSPTDMLIVETVGGPPREFRLSSHFQPIFSLAHRRPVGYEGLIRGTDSNGKAYLAIELHARHPCRRLCQKFGRQIEIGRAHV